MTNREIVKEIVDKFCCDEGVSGVFLRGLNKLSDAQVNSIRNDISSYELTIGDVLVDVGCFVDKALSEKGSVALDGVPKEASVAKDIMIDGSKRYDCTMERDSFGDLFLVDKLYFPIFYSMEFLKAYYYWWGGCFSMAQLYSLSWGFLDVEKCKTECAIDNHVLAAMKSAIAAAYDACEDLNSSAKRCCPNKNFDGNQEAPSRGDDTLKSKKRA